MSRSNKPTPEVNGRHQWGDENLRRFILIALIDGEGETMSIEYLLDSLIDCNTTTYQDYDRLIIRLHHVILPALEQFGVLQYSIEDRQVDVDRETTIQLLYDTTAPIPIPSIPPDQ